jgi:hypothetical protein
MTERQYVETIRKVAGEYVKLLDEKTAHDAREGAYWEWHDLKHEISPKTAIALCDAWLTMQEAAE